MKKAKYRRLTNTDPLNNMSPVPDILGSEVVFSWSCVSFFRQKTASSNFYLVMLHQDFDL